MTYNKIKNKLYDNKITLLVLAGMVLLVFGILFVDNDTVFARHNINHCAEIVGSDNNADFDACVAAAPDTISEQSAWCEANRSDSEFESCMLNEFGVDVTSSGAAPSTTPTTEQDGGTSRDSFSGGQCEPEEGEELNAENCGIIKIVVNVINFLSAVAGIAIVASLMIAGYSYMTAQDNSGQIEKAKSRIIQTLLALTLFIFMYALLNFLIPGGLGLG